MRNLIALTLALLVSQTAIGGGQFDGIWQKDGTTEFASLYQGNPGAEGVSSIYEIDLTHTGGLSGTWDGLAVITPVPLLGVATLVTVTSVYGTKVKNLTFTSLTTATTTSISCTPSATAPAGWCGGGGGGGGGVRTHTKLPL